MELGPEQLPILLSAFGTSMTRRDFAQRLARQVKGAAGTAPSDYWQDRAATVPAARLRPRYARVHRRYPAGRRLAWSCQVAVNQDAFSGRPGQQARDPAIPAATEPPQGVL